MNKAAFDNLFRILDGLKPRDLYLGTWMERTPTKCGAVACIIGHCTMDSWFKDRGFHLESYYGNFQPTLTRSDGVTWTAWSAVSQFFGISVVEAQHLFGTWAYGTLTPPVSVVQERIVAFCQGGRGETSV